jgi:hypothetical protein
MTPHSSMRCRPRLLTLLPDVHVYSDSYKGAQSGHSPGYGITLTAHSTSGCVYASQVTSGDPATLGDASKQLPEDMGSEAAVLLLDEIARGGCIDTSAQPLVLTLMALCPEDVSRVRVGQLGPLAIATLRLLKEMFGIMFKLTPQRGGAGSGKTVAKKAVGSKRNRGEISGDTAPAEGDENDVDGPVCDPVTHMPISADVGAATSSTSILVSCLGMGYSNMSKKVT